MMNPEQEPSKFAAVLLPKGKLALGNGLALSRREVDVLQLLVEGCSNPEIANLLSVSRKTVEFHVSNILGKLAAKNRTDAAIAGIHLLQIHRTLSDDSVIKEEISGGVAGSRTPGRPLSCHRLIAPIVAAVAVFVTTVAVSESIVPNGEPEVAPGNVSSDAASVLPMTVPLVEVVDTRGCRFGLDMSLVSRECDIPAP